MPRQSPDSMLSMGFQLLAICPVFDIGVPDAQPPLLYV